jgi:hypothetical protein
MVQAHSPTDRFVWQDEHGVNPEGIIDNAVPRFPSGPQVKLYT